MTFVDFFHPDGAMRYTSKSKMLSNIEIIKYLLPLLTENPDLGATVTNFMAIFQFIDYSKFERFSNVVDEIFTKLI